MAGMCCHQISVNKVGRRFWRRRYHHKYLINIGSHWLERTARIRSVQHRGSVLQSHYHTRAIFAQPPNNTITRHQGRNHRPLMTPKSCPVGIFNVHRDTKVRNDQTIHFWS